MCRFSAAAAVASLFLASAASATTIDPLLWQELAESADFIGVVECTVAGGIVAKYRVVEVVKGEQKPGDEIAIRTAVNYWEPQYPLALVGDTMLVTAYRNRTPSTMMSTTSGGPVPLWWRRIPYDYSLPLFQGSVPAGDAKQLHGIGSEHASIDAFKKDVREYLSLEPAARELVLLRALSRKYLGRTYGTPSAESKKVLAAIEKAKDLSQAVDLIVAASKKKPDPNLGDPYYDIVDRAGPMARERAWGKKEEPHEDDRSAAATPVPTPAPAKVLERWRAGLGKEAASGEALDGLIVHDPAALVAWMLTWENPKKSWTDEDRGYTYGSWFGARCAKDRAAHLTTLLKAKDPFVHAAAAIYLAFEDETAGVAALKEAMKLEGDPGAWAGLALARRGDRDGLVRAIDVLAAPSNEGGMASVPRRNLQKRVAEILSNTAASAGKQTPVRPHQADGYEAAKAFLAANPDLKPVDPWFAELRSQKID